MWWLEVSWRPCESSSTTIKLLASFEETKQPWTAESWTPEQQHKEDTEKHLSHSLNLHFRRLTDAVIQSVVRMWSIILHYLLSGSSHVTAVCQQCVEVLLVSWRPQWNEKRKKRKKPQQQAEWITHISLWFTVMCQCWQHPTTEPATTTSPDSLNKSCDFKSWRNLTNSVKQLRQILDCVLVVNSALNVSV